MNSVHLVGTLAGTPRTVGDTATPCCTARLCVEELGKDGQVYKTWMPLECWGQAAITLGLLQEGTPRAISSKLQWKAWEKDGKKQGSLVVSYCTGEVLTLALAANGKETHE
jgi:single-stranded DNA-binding protein